MQSIFGWYEPAGGSQHNDLLARIPALREQQRIDASDCRLSTSAQQFGLAESSQALIFLMGQPKWRGGSASLQAIALNLLVAYRERGVDALADLKNAFTLVIIDRQQRRAHVAIDRIGRYPLAYALTPSGGLCFASDARWVARAIDHKEINPQAVFDYAFFHVIPSPETIFRNVAKLPPASRIDYRDARIETAYYWRPQFTRSTDASWDALSKEFLSQLAAGVRATQPSDSTASFLSGGIDSSTVTGLLAEQRGRGRAAYTIGFQQEGYDETEYARIAAQRFGADLRINYVTTDDVERGIDELAGIYDEPFGNSSAVPALVCARIAKRDGISQLLAGDGGDELFAGNTRYAKQRIFELYGKLPGVLRSASEALLLNSSALVSKTPLRKVASYVQQARIPLPDRFESYNFLLRENIPTIFTPEFLQRIDLQHPFAAMREPFNRVSDAATLDRMLYLDWKFTLADNDLRKVVATCQRAGVHVAFPWLDDDVIEFSTRVPASWKMRGTKLRYFVKDALSDFLPEATITKSKHGFGLPFGQWLKTSASLQARVYALLRDLGKRDIFQAQFIERLIAEHQSGHAAYYGTMVWVLAQLEAWLQTNDCD